MTLYDLSQYYHLCKEIEEERERLAELRSRAEKMTREVKAAPARGGVRDRAEIVGLIVECEELIEEKEYQSLKERLKIERYVLDIPDALTRRIFKLRFIKLFSWPRVAAELEDFRLSDEAVKKICYRYIKKH